MKEWIARIQKLKVAMVEIHDDLAKEPWASGVVSQKVMYAREALDQGLHDLGDLVKELEALEKK